MSRARENIRANVRRLRRAKNLSQEALSTQANLDPQTVSRLERGRTAPSWETIQLLAEALGVEMQALTTDPPNDPEAGA